LRFVVIARCARGAATVGAAAALAHAAVGTIEFLLRLAAIALASSIIGWRRWASVRFIGALVCHAWFLWQEIRHPGAKTIIKRPNRQTGIRPRRCNRTKPLGPALSSR
jgi:hypothetical protein